MAINNSSDFHGYKDEIDDWADMWEKAMSTDAFKDETPPLPSSHSSTDSFFGMSDAKETDVAGADSEYWKKMSDMVGAGPDEVLAEMLKPKTSIKDDIRRVVQSPNPVPANTVGKDSDPLTGETVPFYNAEDLQELSALKVKLQEMQEKLGSIEAKGDKAISIDKKMTLLQKQIDELSDEMGGLSDFLPDGGK